MKAERFWATLKSRQATFFSGVPCSILTAALEEAERDPEIVYIPAVREDAALGVASSAYLSGRLGGILIQNSGLGNIVNALTSFNLLYQVPVLLGITWRGYQGKDAPEHRIMGQKMLELLELLEIPAFVVSAADGERAIHGAIDAMERSRMPSALILPPGSVT